ncbi:MAG: deoxyribodipyrimidine photo-lyase [Aeromicrobium sp.]
MPSSASRSILWFRRDLRLSDNPALFAAAGDGSGTVVPLYVVDPTEWDGLGAPQRAYRRASLESLSDRIGGLYVLHGDPVEVVPHLASLLDSTVYASADFTPYGISRDAAVAELTELRVTGSPYAVSPGRIFTKDGSPYRVFTPYYKAWLEHGWKEPVIAPNVRWHVPTGGDGLPTAQTAAGFVCPEAGEVKAHELWRAYTEDDLAAYADVRDLPGADRTSRMSIPLSNGEIHPRTLLADLGPDDDAYRRQLAFREFYADVLFHRGWSAWDYYDSSFAKMRYDEPGVEFDAWRMGRTGFPIVDAGMRQLLHEGWMHNRVRMIVASFLVKDLHIEWQHGAQHFLQHLIDADLASNQHSWQWVAGCGTDAAPYFRVFNPISQGKKFDPNGDYLRRHIPELASLGPDEIHEPWRLEEPPSGYPKPLLDHAVERLESLERYGEIRSALR